MKKRKIRRNGWRLGGSSNGRAGAKSRKMKEGESGPRMPALDKPRLEGFI